MTPSKVCKRCAEPLVTPARFCGWCVEELERDALSALKENRPGRRSQAILFLREQGYSPEQVERVQSLLVDGGEVDDALKRLRGVPEAVAA